MSEGTRDSCSAGTTLAVLAQTQIDVLGHYAAAVLEGSQLMWLGYSYSNGDLIQDGQERYNSLPSSFFTNESNFDLNASENISNDTCIAVNQLSKLVRRPCGETLKWSLCMIIYDPGKYWNYDMIFQSDLALHEYIALYDLLWYFMKWTIPFSLTRLLISFSSKDKNCR